MTKHQRLIYRLKRRHLITSLIFTILACGITCYLFCSAGPINKYLRIDLGFLILPFLGYYILRLLSRLIGALMRSFTGKIAANILNGTAFSFFSYFLFSQALLFTRLPGMGTAQTFFNEVSHLAIPAVLFFTGFTIFNIAKLLTITPRERLVSPASRCYWPNNHGLRSLAKFHRFLTHVVSGQQDRLDIFRGRASFSDFPLG